MKLQLEGYLRCHTECTDFKNSHHRPYLSSRWLIKVIFEIDSPKISSLNRTAYVMIPDMTP